MATPFADILFFVIVAAITVAQAFILRSTARGMRHSGEQADGAARSASLEWTYAIVPALALVALLAFSWRAMHPAVIHTPGVVPPGISGT